MPSQSYTLFDIPEPQMKLVHVHPGAEELGRVYQPDARHQRRADRVLRGARRLAAAERDRLARREPTTAHADYLAWTEKATPQPGGVNLGEIMVWLREQSRRRTRSSPTAPAISPAGSIASTASANSPRMSAPTSGSMGYGLPAAVAMKTLHPERTVVCVAGDGDFLMTGQDFATAVQYELPIIVVVADNGLYGTIRMHQEREYPGRVVATELEEPGFRRLCHGVRRLRRHGREDRRFPRGFRRRAIRQAVDHPSQDRPRSDLDAGNDALRHPREVAGRRSGEAVRPRD